MISGLNDPLPGPGTSGAPGHLRDPRGSMLPPGLRSQGSCCGYGVQGAPVPTPCVNHTGAGPGTGRGNLRAGAGAVGMQINPAVGWPSPLCPPLTWAYPLPDLRRVTPFPKRTRARLRQQTMAWARGAPALGPQGHRHDPGLRANPRQLWDTILSVTPGAHDEEHPGLSRAGPVRNGAMSPEGDQAASGHRGASHRGAQVSRPRAWGGARHSPEPHMSPQLA